MSRRDESAEISQRAASLYSVLVYVEQTLWLSVRRWSVEASAVGGRVRRVVNIIREIVVRPTDLAGDSRDTRAGTRDVLCARNSRRVPHSAVSKRGSTAWNLQDQRPLWRGREMDNEGGDERSPHRAAISVSLALVEHLSAPLALLQRLAHEQRPAHPARQRHGRHVQLLKPEVVVERYRGLVVGQYLERDQVDALRAR